MFELMMPFQGGINCLSEHRAVHPDAREMVPLQGKFVDRPKTGRVLKISAGCLISRKFT